MMHIREFCLIDDSFHTLVQYYTSKLNFLTLPIKLHPPVISCLHPEYKSGKILPCSKKSGYVHCSHQENVQLFFLGNMLF